MKKNLLYLTMGISIFGAVQGMNPPEQFDLTNPFDIVRRAEQDNLVVDFLRATEIANFHLLTALGIRDPQDLKNTATANTTAAITIEEARSIIEKTFFADLKNPFEVMTRARDLGIPVTFEDAKRIALRELFLDTFMGWTRPAEIKARALAIGYPMTTAESVSLAIDLFEKRIAPEQPHLAAL